MNVRRRLRFLFATLFAVPFAPAACGADGIVGGECRTGYAQCQGECLRVIDDPSNCGACGRRCEPGLSCVAGQCVLPDGSGGVSGDSGVDGDANPDQSQGGDGSDPDGSAGDGSGGDGSLPDGSLPDGADPDAGDADDLDADDPDAPCLPPFNTPFRCGDCDTRCTPEEFCSPVDDGYACVPCTPPTRRCGNVCVDLMSDPFNCGRCGNVCPTRICQAGRCVGAVAGHLVLMCSNYEQTPADSPHTRALANAVFLSISTPVRILAYQQYTVPANKTKVDGLINGAAAIRGRSVQFTPAMTSADVVSSLNVFNYDVLLVYDQPNAPAGVLGPMGDAWENSLRSFARAGGIVIVMNSGTGRAEMDELMTTADLLPVTDESDIDSQVFNLAPGDAIGIGVLSPYQTQRQTCTFNTTARPGADTAFVVGTRAEDGTAGDPVIVHRIVAP